MKISSKIAIAVVAVGVWLFARKNKSVSGIGWSSRRYFGGNSGYDGYSMSVRAIEARAEGKFPKTDFRRFYGLTPKVFNLLRGSEIIMNYEWHHTSSYGNETPFYEWDRDDFYDIYKNNKEEISKLAKDKRIYEYEDIHRFDRYNWREKKKIYIPEDIKERIWEIFNV